MATITIRDLPEAVHNALKSRALEHGTTLNCEVVTCLQAYVEIIKPDTKKLLEQVDRVRNSDQTLLNPELLKSSIEEGRP